ncbi:TonB-dependent receptor domain-containing protein [Runella limosa]|uniref:TonB-dependent receptor domain-containing protein n=1 Tax=Runella limosa TaxID=370978 RepID=UPI0004901DAB|nr:outer membrane beta-barrel family protein [Runella limosa]
MKPLYLLFSLLSIYHSSISQNKSKKINGIVLDSLSNQPLPHATIQLTTINEKLYTTSDINGKYTFKKLTQGDYEITGNYVGYRSKKIQITLGETDEITVPTIALSLENINLKEVKVRALKPLFTEESGKTIVNVAESVMANAGTIVDVLKYAPSLIVNENSISIRGKEAIVLIDGRQTNVSGESLEGILNAMPSNSIEKIELISNPGAKYDATGKAVINIRTLKMKNLGTTGTWTAGVGTGRLPRYNGGLLLNHKGQKLSFTGNYTHQFIQQYFNLEATRTLKNPLATSFLDTDFDNRKRTIQFLKLSLDYNITSQTTIGVLLQADQNIRGRNANGATEISNQARLDSVITLQTKGNVRYQNLNANLFFKHSFKQKGRDLAIDADYGYYHTDFQETINNQFFNATRLLTYRPALEVNLPWTQPIQIQSLRGTYVHPTQKGSLESGFQLRHTKVNTDFKYQQQTDNQWAADPKKSFVYDYTETVNAVYVNYTAKIKKLDYQLGIRLEDSYAEGQTQNSTKANQQNYLQLFPSASLQYNPSALNQFSVSYSRKITRPSYSNLNDQIIYTNPYRVTIGNPLLRPTLTTNIELSYLYNKTWSFILSYSGVIDDQTSVYFLRNNVGVIQVVNKPKEELFSLDVSYRKSINDRWRTVSGLNLFQIRNQLGGIEGIGNRNGNGLYAYTNNFFTFNNGWRADFTASYVSPQTLGIYVISPFVQTNISIQKSVFHKNGEIRLSLSDIFNTFYVGQDYDTNVQKGFNKRKAETRFLLFYLNYKFGNKNVKVKERKMGIDKEVSRIDKNQ